jgi:hypothetical protein
MAYQDQQQEMPQNWLQVGDRAPIDLGPSQNAGPAIDMTQPPVVTPFGKGYYLKGDSTRVVLADNRILDLGRDTGAERARMLEDLKIQAQRAQIDQTRAKTAATGSGGQDWMKDFDSSGKLLLVNRRTGEIKRPPEEVVGAKYSADLAGQIAGAKTKGEAAGKRDVNMQGLGDTIQEADDLLKGATGKPLPTGSTFGTAADVVGGAFGLSPSGAAEAQRLKAIGGALTSKMPRMEGPQSDKDVQLYKEMAGVVGDSTVPRDRRIAALDEVKKLWSKYEKQPAAASQAMAPQDAQALAWATANPSDPRAAQIKAKLGVK